MGIFIKYSTRQRRASVGRSRLRQPIDSRRNIRPQKLVLLDANGKELCLGFELQVCDWRVINRGVSQRKILCGGLGSTGI